MQTEIAGLIGGATETYRRYRHGGTAIRIGVGAELRVCKFTLTAQLATQQLRTRHGIPECRAVQTEIRCLALSVIEDSAHILGIHAAMVLQPAICH